MAPDFPGRGPRSPAGGDGGLARALSSCSMSQILADKHIGYCQVIAPFQSWITIQRIEELAPDTILKDDRAVQFLRAQK